MDEAAPQVICLFGKQCSVNNINLILEIDLRNWYLSIYLIGIGVHTVCGNGRKPVWWSEYDQQMDAIRDIKQSEMR